MKEKFNKDFEDFGWSEMQKMLDRELPVADKKRRRGLAFWLFLAIGLTALGIYKFNNFNSINNDAKNDNSVVINNEVKNNNSVATNNELKNNNPIAINNELKTNNSVATNNELKTNNPIAINNELKTNNPIVINNELKTNNPIAINNEVKNNNSVVINNELKNNNPIAINNAVKNNNVVAINNAIKNNELNINSNTPPQYLSEKTVINNAIDATQGTLIPVEQVFALNNKPLKAIKSDSMVINDLKDINPLTKYALIKPIFSKKTHWGITTGIHTEGSKIADGWQFGMVVNHQFKPKLSVSAGLNYRQTRANGNAPLTYYQVEKNAAYTPQSLVVPVKKIVLNQLNYIELPVTINYHFNKKWSVSTGVKAAYLVGAGIATSSDSTLFVFLGGNSNKDPVVSRLDNAQSNNVSALGLQRWDFAAIGGLNFKPTKRLELSLRYDFGLKNVLNQANWSAYNRFIGLNATYYFK